MSEKILTLKLLKETFAVSRLNKNEVIPDWINTSDFYSITKTEDELSIVCSQESVPKDIKHEDDFKALKIEGPLDFSLIGILSKISTILAKSKISIFAISTYDTDYILVKNTDIPRTIEVLSNENYEILI